MRKLKYLLGTAGLFITTALSASAVHIGGGIKLNSITPIAVGIILLSYGYLKFIKRSNN